MRVKRGTMAHAKHKKLFRANKGYRMTKRRLVKVATEAHLHSGEYAFAGRKLRKRDMRKTWITRINEALKAVGLTYSRFIHAQKTKNVELNRKMISYLVSEKPELFHKLVDHVKSEK